MQLSTDLPCGRKAIEGYLAAHGPKVGRRRLTKKQKAKSAENRRKYQRELMRDRRGLAVSKKPLGGR
jgi:hypothetical protein